MCPSRTDGLDQARLEHRLDQRSLRRPSHGPLRPRRPHRRRLPDRDHRRHAPELLPPRSRPAWHAVLRGLRAQAPANGRPTTTARTPPLPARTIPSPSATTTSPRTPSAPQTPPPAPSSPENSSPPQPNQGDGLDQVRERARPLRRLSILQRSRSTQDPPTPELVAHPGHRPQTTRRRHRRLRPKRSTSAAAPATGLVSTSATTPTSRPTKLGISDQAYARVNGQIVPPAGLARQAHGRFPRPNHLPSPSAAPPRRSKTPWSIPRQVRPDARWRDPSSWSPPSFTPPSNPPSSPSTPPWPNPCASSPVTPSPQSSPRRASAPSRSRPSAGPSSNKCRSSSTSWPKRPTRAAPPTKTNTHHHHPRPPRCPQPRGSRPTLRRHPRTARLRLSPLPSPPQGTTAPAPRHPASADRPRYLSQARPHPPANPAPSAPPAPTSSSTAAPTAPPTSRSPGAGSPPTSTPSTPFQLTVDGEPTWYGEMANRGWMTAGGDHPTASLVEDFTPPTITPHPPPLGPKPALAELTHPRDAGHLYAVLDAARSDRALQLIEESIDPYNSLYDGEQARALDDVAPLPRPPSARLSPPPPPHPRRLGRRLGHLHPNPPRPPRPPPPPPQVPHGQARRRTRPRPLPLLRPPASSAPSPKSSPTSKLHTCLGISIESSLRAPALSRSYCSAPQGSECTTFPDVLSLRLHGHGLSLFNDMHESGHVVLEHKPMSFGHLTDLILSILVYSRNAGCEPDNQYTSAGG
jgi:hypothetical protein